MTTHSNGTLPLASVRHVQDFHATDRLDSKGNCRVWRRNGATQTWKRNPQRYRIPVKHGLYAYGEITNETTGMHLPEDCPYATPAERAEHRRRRLDHDAYVEHRADFDAKVKAGTLTYDRDNTGWWIYQEDGRPYELSRYALTGCR